MTPSRTSIRSTLLMLAWLLPSTGWGGSGLPPVLDNALTAYAREGLEALIPAMVKGGPLEGEPRALEQSRNLRRIEKFYGRFRSHDVVQVHRLGRAARLVYFVLNYDRGAVFCRALVYGRDDQASISAFDFNTKPETIFPPQLLASP